MGTLARSLSVITWIFVRLPLGFSLPFSALTIWWILFGFRWIHDLVVWRVLNFITIVFETVFPISAARFLIRNLDAILVAIAILVIFLAGLILAYNASALLNWVLVKLRVKPIRYPTGDPYVFTRVTPQQKEFANVRRIGVVLAGGGAKGAFQAGAMKAIYRYLDENGALTNVRVIAGTSIGAWNTLFWLGDLIKPAQGWQSESIHERWWKSISAKSLTAPSWYVPLLRNAFLSSLPWQQVFDHIFFRPTVIDRITESHIHFYLTRSNVMSGELECVTNNPDPPNIAGVTPEIVNPGGDRTQYMTGLRAGVFGSMDLPPLFPYSRRHDQFFEDGGVIDNLPIVFAAVEACDLIFVLSLNSDFEETPNEVSIFARLFRVMDIRQGVLERSGFKLVYLFNELAALRQDDQRLRNQAGLPNTLEGDSPLAIALNRQHGHINIFGICPQRPFVNNTIKTHEFWKRRGAAKAFRVMYDATWKELRKFRFGQPKDKVRIVLVSEGGDVTWKEDIF